MLSTRWTNPRDPDHYPFIVTTGPELDPFKVDEIKYGPFRCIGGDNDAFRIWTFKYKYSLERFCAAHVTRNLSLLEAQRL